jgi:hypothetical protein
MSTEDEKQVVPASPDGDWRWPIHVTRYDRSPELTNVEQEALRLFVKPPRDRAVVLARAEQQGTLARLIQPLQDALGALEGEERLKTNTLYLYLRMCARDGRSWWAWEYEDLAQSALYLAGQLFCHAQAWQSHRFTPIQSER